MKYLIVDDHALVTTALTMMLEDRDPQAEVHSAGTAAEALELVERHGDSTDLVILDLSMPDVTGTELMEEIVRRVPALKILVVSGLTDAQSVMQTLQLGAAGFVPKSLDTELLTTAIDFVMKGGVYIPSKLLTESQKTGFLNRPSTPDAHAVDPVHLTERQKDVLAELAKGAPIKRICRDLNLSEGTVKTHVAAIYRAFGARNRTEALLAARRAGYDIAF